VSTSIFGVQPYRKADRREASFKAPPSPAGAHGDV